MGKALATYDSIYRPTNGREHIEAHTMHITHTLKRWLPPLYAMPLHGHNFTLKIRRNPRKFLCNTNTHAVHSRVALKYSVARSKSYISLSTPMTDIPCYTEHVYTLKASDASQIKLRPR